MSPLTALEQLYAAHGALVDFLLFCVLFIALAMRGLSHIMPGRQGKAISVVVGILLAAALLQVERTQGYTIASLGPAAVALVTLLAAAATFQLCRHWNLGILGATAIAAIVALLVLEPGQAAKNVAWLIPLVEIVVAIAVLVLLLSHGDRPRPQLGGNRRPVSALRATVERQQTLTSGAYAELRHLRAEIAKGRKSSAPQLGRLAQRIRALDQDLSNTARLSRSAVRRLLRRAPSEEHARLMRRIEECETIIRDGASIATGHVLLAERHLRSGDFDAAALLVDKATEHVQGLAVIEKELHDVAARLGVPPTGRH